MSEIRNPRAGGCVAVARVLAILGPVGLLPGGCGGGAGGSSPAVTPATNLLAPQIGQSWAYLVSGAVADTGTSVPLTGTATQTYTSTTVPGATMAAVTDVIVTANGQSQSVGGTYDIQVDGTSGASNIVALQDTPNATPHMLQTPAFWQPSALSSTSAMSASTVSTDTNTPFREAFHVIGAERVTVPAGTFAAWKLSQTMTFGTQTTDETDWFVPEIGSAAKEVSTITDSAYPGVTLTVTKVLTSTNVSH